MSFAAGRFASRQGWERVRRSLVAVGYSVGLLLAATAAGAQIALPVNGLVRIGLSARSLDNANRGDVTAAMKAWLLIVAQEAHVPVQTDARVFDTLAEMESALLRERIDVLDAPTDEFIALEKVTPLSRIFTSRIHGQITEQYVLLVNQDGPVHEFKDLRGQTLLLLDSPRTALGPSWLELDLLRRKLPASGRFFGKITRPSKPGLAIFPVFFRQAGAALVTRSSFETASELNPQLARTLRVLDASPEVIPTVGAFRADALTGAVDFYRRSALELGQTEGGRLVLNLFKADAVVEIKDSDLAGTRALLADYARLKAQAATP